MAGTTTEGATELVAFLAGSGAVFDESGCVLNFGEVRGEYDRLRSGCGAALLADSAMLTIRGADRLRFVQGMVTCDVHDVGAGGEVYGYFTSPQGRVLADAVLLPSEDRLDVIVPAAVAGDLLDHLRQYIVMDRVEVSVRRGWSGIVVLGPASEERLRLAGIASPQAEAAFGELVWREIPLFWAADHRRGVPASTLWTKTERLPELLRGLLEQPGIAPVGAQAMEIVRVEEGIPAFGKEFDQTALPQEIGEDAAISYTKGCYLGQEVVARIHYRGKVNRALRGVRLSGGTVPLGTELLAADEDRAVGKMGASVDSPRARGTIGLALLHRRGGESGDRLRLASGERAEVVALPFRFET